MTLVQEETLLDGEAPHGYFLEDGIASVVITVANGDTVEVGIIGIDGVVGIPILLGTGTAPGRTFIQIAGSGFRVNADMLKEDLTVRVSCAITCRDTSRAFWCNRPKRPRAIASTISKSGLPAGCCLVVTGWNRTNST